MKEISCITTVASFEKLRLDKEESEINEGVSVLYCMNPGQFFFCARAFLLKQSNYI